MTRVKTLSLALSSSKKLTFLNPPKEASDRMDRWVYSGAPRNDCSLKSQCSKRKANCYTVVIERTASHQVEDELGNKGNPGLMPM